MASGPPAAGELKLTTPIVLTLPEQGPFLPYFPSGWATFELESESNLE